MIGFKFTMGVQKYSKNTLNPSIEKNFVQGKISEEDSKRITSLRFILIVFVVFIHNCYTSDSIQAIIEIGGTPPVFVENVVGRWVKLFITFGIARCAVPLFFLFSAFLQAKKNDDYGTLLRKRTKSLFVPFLLWNGIYVFYYGVLKLIIAKVALQLLSQPENTILSWSFADWFHKILGYRPDGSGGFKLPELAIQFWFVRDLIILTLLSPILKYFIKKFPLGFLFFISVVYFVPVQVYFVVSQALFFYTLGLYWSCYDIPLFETVDSISWGESITLFLLSFIYIYTIGKGDYETESYFIVICACVILLKISSILIRDEKLYAVLKYLAGFSFFLFVIHEPILDSVVSKIWIKFFPMKNTLFSLLQYFIPTIIVVAVGTGIGIAIKKLCPPLFRLLNGGR